MVELLVVVGIFSVVGAIAVTGIMTAFRSSVETQTRIEARQELELGLQQIARTIRGASSREGAFLLEADDPARQLGIESRFGGQPLVTWFSVETIGDERVLTSCNGEGCLDDSGSRQLVTAIDNRFPDDADDGELDEDELEALEEPVFAYLRLGDDEFAGDNLLPGEADTVRIRLVRALEDRNPVIVETQVSIRNVRYARS